MGFDTDLSPLVIKTGELLEPLEVSGSRYSFQHISLGGLPVAIFPDDFDPNKEEDYLKFFPENVNEVLCFQKIKKVVKSFKENDYSSNVYVDMNQVGEYPSGMITPNGTLIPQIIYPYDFGRNEITVENSETTAQPLFDLAQAGKYYHWAAIKQTSTSDKSDDYTKAAESPRNYGVKYDASNTSLTNSYICMLGKNPYLDPKDFKREYICNFPPTGVFALLLNFSSWEEDPEGKKPCGATFKFYSSDKGNSLLAADTDFVTIKTTPTGQVTISINDKPGVSESLTFNQFGIKIQHINSGALEGKNVIFFYSLLNTLVVTGDLVADPSKRAKHILCKKNPDLDMLSESKPPMDRFPSEHKKGATDQITLSSTKSYITFGDRVQVEWENCIGNFGFAALRFCPVVSFSYFFRMSGEQTNTNDGLTGPEDYYCLMVGGKNFGYKGLQGKYKSKRIFYNADTQTTVFRVDFKFYVQSGMDNLPLQLTAMELLGIIHVTKVTGKLTNVLNDDGDFGNFQSNVNPILLNTYQGIEGNSLPWTRFIESINVSHSLDGSNGSLTLDKYMMNEIAAPIEQVIGALTLVAGNGFYREDGYTRNDQPYVYEASKVYPALPWGQIFRGYAMEIQESYNEGNTSLSVKLEGIQKKLADMKLVNCPFWDGDQVFGDDPEAVLNYFISYTGCDLRYISNFSYKAGPIENVILPRSWDWQAPSTNFVLGTPCLDALREIAKKINHQFVIQPDGRGYFYHMDDYGVPDWIYDGPVRRTFYEYDIIGMSISPYLENRYNTFLTLGILVKNDPETGQLVPDGTTPGMKFTQVPIQKNNYPWSRIITNSEPGVVTIKELEQFHKINTRFGTSNIYSGTVDLIGFHDFYIFDKILIHTDKNGDLEFYITGISHTINMGAKEWTTSLSIATFEPG